MAFIIGEQVVAQLTGGQTGTKNISPTLRGVITNINGAMITIDFDSYHQQASVFFPDSIVDQKFLKHA